MSLQECRTYLEQQKGMRAQVRMQIASVTTKLEEIETHHKDLEQAQALVQEVAKVTQEELEYQVSELGTLAMQAVFPNPYRLAVDFELKRGKSEAVLSLVGKRADDRTDPYDGVGGGIGDIVALALRISLWSLQNPKSRAVLLLDEPFRNINDRSRKLHKKAAELLSKVCNDLKLQVIIITTMPELMAPADRIFNVVKNKKVSSVEVLQYKGDAE